MSYKSLQYFFHGIFKIFNRAEVIGLENIPEDEKIVICANHTSNWDPLLLSSYIEPQIHWMAKSELSKIAILGKLLTKYGVFYVDREKQDIKAMMTAMKLIKNKKIVGIFPEGTRVKEINLDGAKSGVAVIAHRTKAVIVPAYIEGKFKPFRKVRLIIREPIYLDNLPKKLNGDDYEKLTRNIMENIYNIKEIGD